MEKRVSYYMPNKSWPVTLRSEFSGYSGKHGVLSFEEGSDDERRFLTAAGRFGVAPAKRTVVKIGERDIASHPFYYLTVQSDAEYRDLAEFMDFSRACDGGGVLACNLGAVQYRKISVDTRRSKKHDIMTVPGINSPFILLLSRTLKEALAPLSITGAEIVPCLVHGETYSDAEAELRGTSARVDELATHFQLLITSSVINPPQVGFVTRVYSQCPRCNAVYGFESDTTQYFEAGDLAPVDVQCSEEYVADNIGRFRMGADGVIVSSRFLDLVVKKKFKGLVNFLTDPPIRYGVAEIR